MRTIRASELGTYLFCRKAWWYHSQGVETENTAELEAGSGYHELHGRTVINAALNKGLAWFILMLALIALAVGLTLAVIR